MEQVATSTDTVSALPASANSYGYTTINQLASDSTGAYSYDHADNLTAQPTGITQTYDSANQLTSQTKTVAGLLPVTTSYGYNADGDRTSTTRAGVAPVSYSYDQADRLTNYNGVATYAYNGDGLRMSKTIGGLTSQFSYDLDTATPQILTDGTNNYVYGPNGRAVEQIRQATNTVTYLGQDQLGSTRLLTSTSGVIVGALKYDAYGKAHLLTGIQQKVSTPIGYAGGYTDPESGLVYLIHRYYDPTTAQFLTRDPLNSVSRQAYTYATGDPVNASDPSGLLPPLPADYIPWPQLFQLEMAGCLSPNEYEHYLNEELVRQAEVDAFASLNETLNEFDISDASMGTLLGGILDKCIYSAAETAPLGAAGLIPGTLAAAASGCVTGAAAKVLEDDGHSTLAGYVELIGAGKDLKVFTDALGDGIERAILKVFESSS